MNELAQPQTAAPREDEWLSAAETFRRVSEVMSPFQAAIAICTRAHHGLIRCRAERLIMGRETHDNVGVPAKFWWAEGQAALDKNWKSGDFATWIDQRIECKVFGVTFNRDDVQKLIPTDLAGTEAEAQPQRQGGRPPAEWWDDLWAEICRQLYVGDLQPDKQANIHKAMQEWLAVRNYSAADSTIRQRARKLWAVLNKEGD